MICSFGSSSRLRFVCSCRRLQQQGFAQHVRLSLGHGQRLGLRLGSGRRAAAAEERRFDLHIECRVTSKDDFFVKSLRKQGSYITERGWYTYLVCRCTAKRAMAERTHKKKFLNVGLSIYLLQH